jgi:hypothetical protein
MEGAFVFLSSISMDFAIELYKYQSSTSPPYPGFKVSGLFVKKVTHWNMQNFQQELPNLSTQQKS